MLHRSVQSLSVVLEAVLTDALTPFWLPDLTDALVEIGWKRLQNHTHITALEYGTARVLAGHAGAPRHVVACVAFYPGAKRTQQHILIEYLDGDVRHPYEKVGLTLYDPEAINITLINPIVQEAVRILAFVPTLHRTVAHLVRVCHLIKPEHDDYDVSYSDPQVPFSIFVSVPQTRRPKDALRVAESILHEAMHLQLTLIEQVRPLVHPSGDRYFSPWKDEYRSPRGLLHALYVFRVIDQFLERLLALPGWTFEQREHMRQRRGEIALQMREVETFKYCPALTDLGVCFVQRLLGNTGSVFRKSGRKG